MAYRAVPKVALLIFALLSLADLVQTWLLISYSGGRIVESNPIAAAWLHRFGWKGLVLFKGAAFVLVAVAGTLVALHRPRLGRWVLGFCCLVVGLVAIYSYLLLRRYL